VVSTDWWIMVKTLGVMALAALALASCGKQSTEVATEATFDAHALAASADHTVQAGTGKAHLTITVGSGAGTTGKGPSSFTITGDGVYDTRAGLSLMKLDLGAALAGVAGGKTGTTIDPAALQEEVLQHGTKLYLRAPMFAKVDPSFADKWITLDSAGMSVGGGTGTSSLSGVGAGDPSTVLDYLKGAGAEVTTVGHEAINGVDTTHVHATVLMKQALDAAGTNRDKLAESLKGLPGGLEAFEKMDVPVDVFVDAEGYVRRIALAYDLGRIGGTTGSIPKGPSSVSTTTDFSGFGQPVDIVEPTEDETVPYCDVLAKLPAKSTASLPTGLC
jgi:hypothetical protein